MAKRLTLGPDAVADVEEFIHTSVRWAQHNYDEARGWSRDEVPRYIPEYAQILADVRAGAAVKWFENLVSPTLHVVTSTPGIEVRNDTTGEVTTLRGSGVITISAYIARFETAVEAWRFAVDRCSPAHLLTAVTDGFAAIEAYLNARAKAWNATHPDAALRDTRRNAASIREKLTEWVPQMTDGRRIDPTSPFWEHLVLMQRYRNVEAVHRRDNNMAVDLADFVQQVNMFTSGIAIPLLQLHTFFNETIPSIIIRAAYAPEVRVQDGGAG